MKVKKTSVVEEYEEYSSEVLFRAVSCHLTKLFHRDEVVGVGGNQIPQSVSNLNR